ncbi:MAG: hypothetical protein ING00_15440 [Roseomonas sp.]|nr:hypothetical protein [Roseomonas sp.]
MITERGSQVIDVINGTAGADKPAGTSFSDSISGLDGADILDGSFGDDTLSGGAGNDVLYLGRQSDLLFGGAGNGRFFIDVRGFDQDTISDFAAGDIVDVSLLNVADLATLQPFISQVGADAQINLAGDERLVFRNTSVAALGASAFVFNTNAVSLTVSGDSGSDVLFGGNGADILNGGFGSDTLSGGAGNDVIQGGAGTDMAVYNVAAGTLRIRDIGSGVLTVESATLGTDRLTSIEIIQTQDGRVTASSDLSGLFRANVAGVDSLLLGSAYSGPVEGLQRQLLGSSAGEVVSGTTGNDFMNLLGGDDAADGGLGNDVLDGGTGSNFLSGGGGRDVFFSDGRGGTVTWSTITDWQAGEQLSLWGWRPGISRASWSASDGVAGYKGVTMFGDLNADGVIDTSVTWSGLTRAALPTPVEFDGLLWFIG